MELFNKFFLGKRSFADSPEPVITLLYERTFTPDLFDRLGRLDEIEPLSAAPRLRIEQDWETGSVLLAETHFDSHVVQIAGMPAPLPQNVYEKTVYPTGWAPEFKELLQSAGANIILQYAGTATDPIEKYLALYKVAFCLDNERLLGVVNEPAGTAHPRGVIAHILDFELLSVARQSPPLPFWTGFQKVEWNDEIYFLTKGFRFFDLPDLIAHSGTDGDPGELQSLFYEIFHYMYFENKEVIAGDALNVNDNLYYLFGEPEEELAESLAPDIYLTVESMDSSAWQEEAYRSLETETD